MCKDDDAKQQTYPVAALHSGLSLITLNQIKTFQVCNRAKNKLKKQFKL